MCVDSQDNLKGRRVTGQLDPDDISFPSKWGIQQGVEVVAVQRNYVVAKEKGVVVVEDQFPIHLPVILMNAQIF